MPFPVMLTFGNGHSAIAKIAIPNYIITQSKRSSKMMGIHEYIP